MKYRYILFISLIGLLFACQPELDDYSPSKGSADFSTYVAIGNSLTAGYADGSLYRSAQLNSFPSILAQQFEVVGGGEFVQPLMEGEYGILPGKKVLGYSQNCSGETTFGPVDDIGQLEDIAPIGYSVNNLGVPGAKVLHLVYPGFGNIANLPIGAANPYYVRFAKDPATSSVLLDAISMNPTFFSLWIGNNDVLGYAAGGGTGDWITDQDTLKGTIDYIVQNLIANGAKGVIANLPDIMNAPFFKFMQTQIPYNGLVLVRQGQVDSLNFAYQQLGITFSLGQNPFIVEDAAGSPRQMKATDIFLLTLPTDSLKCYGYGSAVAIPHKYILDEDEIEKVNNAIAGYNVSIKDIATTYNLAFVDINSYMKEVEKGVIYDGVKFSTEYITGNAFSLDGIHLTQQGYALVANQFILAINNTYGATVPLVSVANYPANIFP